MKYNRRNFIQSSTSATTALLLSSLDSLAQEKMPAPDPLISTQPAVHKAGSFELKFLATDWGFKGSIDTYCAKVKNEGYEGIEIWWPKEKAGQDALFTALKKYQLDLGLLVAGDQPDFRDHLDHFKHMIGDAAHNTFQRPIYINCHSGRDFFSVDENQAFIDHTLELSARTGILILHETHRSRMLFAAPATRHFIEKNPGLRITLDISHWTNVHNSLLEDQQATVDLALERVDHIHSRIGHPDGPQVNDPRAPEWEDCVKAHLGWWDKVVAQKKRTGGRLTILTEFGPPDYMPALPYTRQPLADQWAINVYMMHLLRKRYLPS
ncbi:sugar phosphate isomerase/epimerase family protein [Flavitalea flava]